MEKEKTMKVAGGTEAPANEAKPKQKISYEQLEAYATQATDQAKRLFQENQMLKKAFYENSLREVEIALKCLDHANMFSNDFVTAVVTRIEEIMKPQDEVKQEEKKEEK